jgi:hypothetical protein
MTHECYELLPSSTKLAQRSGVSSNDLLGAIPHHHLCCRSWLLSRYEHNGIVVRSGLCLRVVALHGFNRKPNLLKHLT